LIGLTDAVLGVVTNPPVRVPPDNGKAKPETKLDVAKILVSVMLPATIEVVPAATAIVAKLIELVGVAGAVGLAAGVPATTVKVTLLVAPE
jgi:hypothetical protein